MKNILFALTAVFVLVGSLSAQSWTRADGARGLVVYKIENWGAFASDSLAIKYTDAVDISMMDSVLVWALTTSSNGTAKVIAGLEVGFTSGTTAANWDSIAVAIDSTGSKLETLWNPLTVTSAKGAPMARICVRGNAGLQTVSATQNRKDTKVYLYLVGRLRGYAQVK